MEIGHEGKGVSGPSSFTYQHSVHAFVYNPNVLRYLMNHKWFDVVGRIIESWEKTAVWKSNNNDSHEACIHK